MAEIHEARIIDIVAQMPDLVQWNPETSRGRRISLLVVCAGFEDRAVAIADALIDVIIDHVLIIEYPTNANDNAASSIRLAQIPSGDVQTITYQRGDFFRTIRDRVSQMNFDSAHDVVVDVSAMASYVLSRTFAALWTVLTASRLRVFYAEAIDYHPTEAAWNDFFHGVTDPNDNLSIAERYEETNFQARGVEYTYECDVFSGWNQGPVATEVVAIPSFSLQRVKSMTAFATSRYNVTPEGIHWFLGSPPDKRRNGWRLDALAKLYNVKSHGTPVDTRDYRDIVRRLDELWDDSVEKERHLVIAGMGSKMQNVGIFLFLQMHQECGLLHCEPKEFIATRYSNGIGPKWEIDFGLTSDIKQLVEKRQSLTFKW